MLNEERQFELLGLQFAEIWNIIGFLQCKSELLLEYLSLVISRCFQSVFLK